MVNISYYFEGLEVFYMKISCVVFEWCNYSYSLLYLGVNRGWICVWCIYMGKVVCVLYYVVGLFEYCLLYVGWYKF